MTEKQQTSQGYIIRILQHFATKHRNITNFVMLFQAVMKFLSGRYKGKGQLRPPPPPPPRHICRKFCMVANFWDTLLKTWVWVGQKTKGATFYAGGFNRFPYIANCYKETHCQKVIFSIVFYNYLFPLAYTEYLRKCQKITSRTLEGC